MDSRLYHYTEIFRETDTDKKIIEKLCNICDENFNGNNGVDFVDKTFLKEGYKSNLDYYYNIYKHKYLYLGDRLYYILSENYNKNYYKDSHISITKIGATYVASVAAIKSNKWSM